MDNFFPNVCSPQRCIVVQPPVGDVQGPSTIKPQCNAPMLALIPPPQHHCVLPSRVIRTRIAGRPVPDIQEEEDSNGGEGPHPPEHRRSSCTLGRGAKFREGRAQLTGPNDGPCGCRGLLGLGSPPRVHTLSHWQVTDKSALQGVLVRVDHLTMAIPQPIPPLPHVRAHVWVRLLPIPTWKEIFEFPCVGGAVLPVHCAEHQLILIERTLETAHQPVPVIPQQTMPLSLAVEHGSNVLLAPIRTVIVPDPDDLGPLVWLGPAVWVMLHEPGGLHQRPRLEHRLAPVVVTIDQRPFPMSFSIHNGSNIFLPSILVIFRINYSSLFHTELYFFVHCLKTKFILVFHRFSILSPSEPHNSRCTLLIFIFMVGLRDDRRVRSRVSYFCFLDQDSSGLKSSCHCFISINLLSHGQI
mmetsp:Transcript_33319/g.43959  ORF Transcript_33319/g.43959 Transcript_33319/m.43959 type:complete len:411 (-) Transcript_33319:107-1339(-)